MDMIYYTLLDCKNKRKVQIVPQRESYTVCDCNSRNDNDLLSTNIHLWLDSTRALSSLSSRQRLNFAATEAKREEGRIGVCENLRLLWLRRHLISG